MSVTQAAIKGDRLVADGVGRAAKLLGGAGVKRFGRDVLGQAGADMVLVKLGANDLIHPHCRSKQGLLTPVTFAQMTAGYRALADMAHAQGVRIWFCELTPWKGYTRNLFGRGTTFSGHRNMTRCGWSSTPGSRARTARRRLYPAGRSGRPRRPGRALPRLHDRRRAPPRPGSGRSPR